jgi:hypothetical protein
VKATPGIVAFGFGFAGVLASAVAHAHQTETADRATFQMSWDLVLPDVPGSPQQIRARLERAHVAQVSPDATQRREEFDREFKLRNGEAAQVGNESLVLRFERVTTDGRCPVGDPCVSGVGDAVVLVTVEQPPHEPAGLELHTDPSSTPEGLYLRYRVRLVRLEPRPVGEQYVPLPQYWATFVVSR